ncbi:MAG TPA: TetR/AcrR family transcriptional regulator [Acidimicrobiales bacterium]
MPRVAKENGKMQGALQRRVGTYSGAQIRVATTATELFSVHGVAGTSLQMIADAMGVTKAAVYHQFNTKEAIVLACTEVQLAFLERLLDDAAVDEDQKRAREQVLAAVIDMTVARRRSVGALQNDPSVARLLAEHPPFRRIQTRLRQVLSGERSADALQVQSAMIFAALTGAVSHPMVADIDDETLRRELGRLVGRLLELDDRTKGVTGSNR